MKSVHISLAIGAIAAMVAVGELPSAQAQTIRVSELPSQTHIHGLAVDRQDSNYLLIATHHGLFRAGPDAKAEPISVVQDFMGFNAHPSDPDALFASGHPAEGGNLGFIASTDRGRTWEQISPGAGGPVDFHQMTVSPADPETIYGVYGALQVSHDAGKSWTVVGKLPERLIDLAASAKDAATLYAATEGRLLVSRDGGLGWETVFEGAPVSMVEVAPDGRIYAFGLVTGLLPRRKTRWSSRRSARTGAIGSCSISPLIRAIPSACSAQPKRV
jgi:photosystem II stability/assembly factor-like uncharacterized protein